MKKILIVPKIIIGIEPTMYGFDDEGRWFKKTFSTRLSDRLTKMFREEKMEYEVFVNTEYTRNVQEFIGEYDVLLLSPYIVNRIDLTSLDPDAYYVLNRDEFEKGHTEKISLFLKNKRGD